MASRTNNITLGFAKRAERFFWYARERYQILQLRRERKRAPWTNDPILQQWRFCNVFREDDTTTEWFRTEVRDRLKERPFEVLLSTVMFRWFNRISTGEKILGALRHARFKPDELRTNLNTHRPLVTGAYMIKTPPGMNKLEGIIWCLEQAHDKLFPIVNRAQDGGLRETWERLRELPYLGNFMAYEVVTDLRHTCLLRDAPDINTWASPGPGAARGLGRLFGDIDKYNYNSAAHRECMITDMAWLLAASREAQYWPAFLPPWEMREVEHTLCEFDKYERVREGGKLKQRYEGGA